MTSQVGVIDSLSLQAISTTSNTLQTLLYLFFVCNILSHRKIHFRALHCFHNNFLFLASHTVSIIFILDGTYLVILFPEPCKRSLWKHWKIIILR